MRLSSGRTVKSCEQTYGVHNGQEGGADDNVGRPYSSGQDGRPNASQLKGKQFTAGLRVGKNFNMDVLDDCDWTNPCNIAGPSGIERYEHDHHPEHHVTPICWVFHLRKNLV